MTEKSEECDGCGFGTEMLTYVESSDARGSDHDDTPWTLRSHWLCRLCYTTGLGYEVYRGRVSHGIVQALNIILERLDRLDSENS